jgi:hypothetical protein
MTRLPAGAPLAISWFPTTVGGFILYILLLLALSWWLMGKVFRERDLTTLIFRGMMSALVCIGVGFFQQSLADLIRGGPLNSALATKAEDDANLRQNMQRWVAPAAYDGYWNVPATEVRKVLQMSPAERKEFEASQVTPAILVESAVRGLAWMALEHQHPSPFGRKTFPHAERGTKVLNDFTDLQAQAMFDYVRIVGPSSMRDARPYLEDALAYCREAAAPATSGSPSGKPAAVPYPYVQATRETSRGRAFLIRLSATRTQVVEAGSEEEALKLAKQPSPPAHP